MATSDVEIWNLALAKCGSSQRVSSSTENSAQANAVRQFYVESRRYVLAQAPWSCALTWARLAVRAERDFSRQWLEGDPGPDWRFAYSVPNDMLAPFFLMSYGKFELALHEGTPALMANQSQAMLRYVQDQPVVGFWDAELTSAIVSMLAFNIAPIVNAKFGSRDRLQRDANDLIMKAIEKTANEMEGVVEALPGNISARGYTGSAHQHTFFHTFSDPNGNTF